MSTAAERARWSVRLHDVLVSECPSEARIDRFLRGADDVRSRAELEAHADRCDDCCSLLAALAPSRPPVPATELAAGTCLGRYTVLRSIGKGAMGEVFAAHDRELDRTVAIKLWHHDSPSRLLVEARGLARVCDPNVVALHDVGCAGDRVFAVMELVEGTTLGQWLAQRRRGVDERMTVLLQAGRGLAAVHACRLVHRDFKPDNVLVGHDGRVRVADLGLVGGLAPTRRGESDVAPELCASTIDMLAGTPAYMAPEVLRGAEADAAADQYGYAVVVWEALFGRRPFVGRDLITQLELAEGGQCVPPRGHAVPRRIVRVLLRALDPDPRERFASMTALLEALAGATRPRRFGGVARVGLFLAATTLCGSIGHFAAERFDHIWTETR